MLTSNYQFTRSSPNESPNSGKMSSSAKRTLKCTLIMMRTLVTRSVKMTLVAICSRRRAKRPFLEDMARSTTTRVIKTVMKKVMNLAMNRMSLTNKMPLECKFSQEKQLPWRRLQPVSPEVSVVAVYSETRSFNSSNLMLRLTKWKRKNLQCRALESLSKTNNKVLHTWSWTTSMTTCWQCKTV